MSHLCCADGAVNEDSLEVAAAVAAAKKQAAAVAGKRPAAAGALSHAGPGSKSGPAGSKGTAGGDTDAFLAAMMKAEQAHERRAAAGRGGGGDKLQQLMAGKGKGQQVRAGRHKWSHCMGTAHLATPAVCSQTCNPTCPFHPLAKSHCVVVCAPLHRRL